MENDVVYNNANLWLQQNKSGLIDGLILRSSYFYILIVCIISVFMRPATL